MSDEADSEPVSFLGRDLPEWLALVEVAIPPGGERPYDPGEWGGTLVVVERGTLEVVCLDDRRARFAGGAVLFLAHLPLRTLRNPGAEPLLLTAVSRRSSTVAPAPQHQASDEAMPRSASHE